MGCPELFRCGGKLQSFCVCILQRTGNPFPCLVCTISEAALGFDSSRDFYGLLFNLNQCGMNYVTGEKWAFVEINACHQLGSRLLFWHLCSAFFCVVMRCCCARGADCPQRGGERGREMRGWVGFMHQQELVLAAPSVASCVIQGVFWAAKLHLQDENRRNYRYRGGKAESQWIFLKISWFLLFALLLCCVSVVPLCCGEQEMLSWRLYWMGVM